jgi:hypothetical protein
MSYLVTDLIDDIMQRAGRLKNEAGITLLGAANSIQSMLAKKLVDRKSDLIVASSSLSLNIPSQGCYASLPSGFISLAEKVKSQDLYTDWIMGIVAYYWGPTGALTIDMLDSHGSDTISAWNISTVPVPGSNAEIIGTSLSTLTVGVIDLLEFVGALNPVSLVITPGLTLPVGTPLYITPLAMPTGLNVSKRTLEPNYLNSDDGHDIEWWTQYGMYGWEWEAPSRNPHHYKIIGTTLYIRPYAIYPLIISGRYFGLPSLLTNTSEIPFNGLFDEIFREGIVRIIQKGLSIPESDPDFNIFLMREFDSVINSRMNILGKTRTHHSNFM